ncbi:unnamed protein product [Gongylonema pulchrum]|uniref:Amino_oxidase domain-containing protein n=1 Tax=Gongylonema pulchrum TaxID=637853 RepID=A0A183CXY2_9BILA|nr:unnamed protein product [Gongylonema pulchrum]
MTAKLPSEWFHFGCKLQNQLQVTGIDATAKSVTYENEQNGMTRQNELVYDVVVVGVGLKKPVNPYIEQYTWLYFPEKSVPFYRLTFLSQYGEMTPDSSKYWSVMCECARARDDEQDTEDAITEQTVEGLIRKSIITREQIVSVFSTYLPYGYPIPSVNRDAELARAHHALENHHIYSRGRFGGWKYETSNQDHCFIQGKEIIDRLLLNEPEKVYKTGLPTYQG